jgi:TonB family protein
MVKQALLIGTIAALVACGGKKGQTTPDPDTGGGELGGGGEGIPNNNQEGDVVSAETLDEIQRMFQRKGSAVSRCLAFAVDNKELPKNSRGKVTLEVTITPSGAPGDVKVLKASIESKSLNDCIIERVKEIQFPEIPNAYPATYTYAFEAM